MDLNELYAQHQRSLMQAAATRSRLTRTKQLVGAGAIGNRIRDFQLSKGAPAAAGWLRSMDPWAAGSAGLLGISS